MSLDAMLLPLVQKIDQLLVKKKPVIVALDGKSGVGKSTIAKKISKKFNAAIIKADDFYAGPPGGNEANWHNKSPEEKINQVLDYDRLRLQVLLPLVNNEQASYYPFDFEKGRGLSEKVITVQPADVIIIDGVYSALQLSDLIDISILVEHPDKDRRKRLLLREGAEFMNQWHNIWDEAEDYYFSSIRPRNSFDLVLG